MSSLRMLVLCMFLLLSLAVAYAETNIYPDPSFEASGVTGQARTGERAGHLAVGARNHWDAIGGQIPVEPFARYRVTEWVKGSVTGGSFCAPYCYGWDSYEWCFSATNAIQTLKEWTQVTAEFVTPQTTMYVHPLGYTDSENCDVWVDDVVVEKVAEPEQVMAELCAKAGPSDNERKLIARWYVKQAKLDAAAEVMKPTWGLTRADIATVLAKAVDDLAVRNPLVVDVIANGGPTYFQGMDRFREVARGMTEEQRLGACIEAAKLNPGEDRCARSVRLVVEGMSGWTGGVRTVAEESARLDGLRAPLGQAIAAIPADSAVAKELQSAMKSVDDASAKLEQRKASLGHCVVEIGGKPIRRGTHAIIIPNNPTAQEQYAAQDLRYHLELITGDALPIWYEKDAANATPIYVGKCEKTAASGVDFGKLGLEGLWIKTAGPSVMLAGNKRGVHYAVSTFLEDYLDCRWFTPDCATWPKDGSIALPEIDRRYIPPLEFRMGDYPVARNSEFALHLRLDGDNHGMSDEQGGQRGVHGLAHTFAGLCPPERYFKDHPEYFSLVGGKRQSGYAQLCLTNPEVLKVCIAGVRQWIRDNPQKKVFSVSQNDTANYCECDNCRAVAEEEGSQMGPVLRFVNAVADNIKDDYPDVAIETLAYQYTRKPPLVTKPRPNVIICLCSIECCFVHPLETDEFNASFKRDIEGWHAISNRLWIWDYIINYAHSICPFPNLYVLEPNISFFITSGVTGIYEESCYYTKGSEMQELRNYVMAKALWDPTTNTDRNIDEFCAAFYGKAAPQVRQYVNLVQEITQRDPKQHVMIYTHPRSFVTKEMIDKSRAIFDAAEAAAKDDPVALHRVQVARLPMLYAEITLATGGTLAERGDKLIQEGGTDVTALADQFDRIAKAEGVTMVSEGGSYDGWIASVPKRAREIKIERIQNPALQLAVLPDVGGRIWRMKQLATGRDLLTVAGKEGAWNPLDGGYEEYSENGYRSPGWSEAYSVTEKSDRAITMEVALRNGLKLTRRIELDPVKPLVSITSTLTNATAETKTLCLRTHPEFAVSSTGKASARVMGADGKWRTITLFADPLAEKDEWLRETDVPAGAWAVVDGAADVAIVDRFDRAQIGQCLLNRSGASKRVNLELFSPETPVAAGKSITIAHTYEVTGAGGF